jgi:hypothetical protein
MYRIAGNFRGVQFRGWPVFNVFADACDHAHCTLYNRTYFAGLIFADSCLSAKTAKVGPHEKFSPIRYCSQTYIVIDMVGHECVRERPPVYYQTAKDNKIIIPYVVASWVIL